MALSTRCRDDCEFRQGVVLTRLVDMAVIAQNDISDRHWVAAPCAILRQGSSSTSKRNVISIDFNDCSSFCYTANKDRNRILPPLG